LKEIRLNNKVSWLETVGRENTTFYWNLYPRLLFLFLLNWKIVDLNFEGLANRGIYIGKHFQLVFLVTCVKIIFQNMRLITIRTIFFNWFSLILKYIFKLRKVVFFGKMVKSNICRRNISCSNTGWHLKRIWKTALHPMYGIVPRTLDTLIGFLESLYYIVTFPIVSVCCMFIIRSACFSEDWTTDALPEVKECLFNLYCWVIIAKIIEQSNHYVCRWHSF
jgi:hypothetical protein